MTMLNCCEYWESEYGAFRASIVGRPQGTKTLRKVISGHLVENVCHSHSLVCSIYLWQCSKISHLLEDFLQNVEHLLNINGMIRHLSRCSCSLWVMLTTISVLTYL